jgi:hypothetical protein
VARVDFIGVGEGGAGSEGDGEQGEVLEFHVKRSFID